MTIRVSTLAVWAGVLWACFGLCATLASAQSRATGTTGSTGVTQLTPTQATSLNSNASSSGTTSAGGGSAGGGGGSSVEMNTGNQPEFNAGDGSVGAQVGQNGFTGRTNTAFAGNRNATQGGNTSLLPQFNQLVNQANTANQGNTGRSNLKRARPQQRIAFTYPKANLVATQVQMSERFQRMTSVSGASASISDEGVATLTGVVTSDDSRKLAEALARLEPGVRSVVNELKVEAVSP
jgi:osmotically-inducible protein OsmY